MNADRHLLLGILALQNSFINRQQLLAAFDQWTREKQLSLGQILEDQDAITADRRLLLEALVSEHLKLHDNDPEKSLADLTPIGSVRDELECFSDVDVDASLALVSMARDSDPYATRVWSVGESTSSGTRFRVLRPHARGGLVEVYVAHDEELHREVALKEIQAHHADDPSSRARFLLEAEITGGLEHPGIVPVYGLGTYADGRPFYAMRFIKGDSLKEAARRFHAQAATSASFASLEFRKLLGRFIDVCNAIEYAHSRGVLHRDLKPGNIMLGKYGETLVVDWGLAKVLGRRDDKADQDERTLQPNSASGSSATQMGSAVGTPQYMSPEQAEGRLDQLGPTSDVYSLGATLYTLLTGQPAFCGKELAELLTRVTKGDFTPPRVFNPAIPRPLEAICLKAMSLRPAERYASPRFLADDIEHWLADDRVSALSETISERISRFGRRHRAAARSAAAALVFVSIVSVFAAVGIDIARRAAKTEAIRADREGATARLAEQTARNEAQRANLQARAAKLAESRANEQAERADREANAAKLAERNAREVANFLGYLFKGADPLELSGAPGGGKNDAAVLTARVLLDRGRKLVSDRGYDSRVRAMILDTLGDVERSFFNYEAADQILHESLTLREGQLEPDDPDYAESLCHLGRLQYDRGFFAEAERLLRRALTLLVSRLGNEDLRVANVKLTLAWLRISQRDHDETEKLFHDALDIRLAKLPEGSPDVAAARFGLASILLTRGKYLSVIPIAKQALNALPDGDAFLHAVIDYIEARIARTQRRFDEAEKLHLRALDGASRFLGPRHFLVLMAEGDLAHMLLEKGDHEGYERRMRRVLETARKSPLAGHPEMIKAMMMLAQHLRSRGDHVEAEKLYREILAYCQVRGDPPDETAMKCLADVLRQQGRQAEADALFTPAAP